MVTKIYVRLIILLYQDTMSCVSMWEFVINMHCLPLIQLKIWGKTITQNKTTAQLNFLT